MFVSRPGATGQLASPLFVVVPFAEALKNELGGKGIKVSLVEPGLTSADLHYPDLPAERQRDLIGEEKMLWAQDIAVGVHYLLTQPSRVVVQQLTIVPRKEE